MTRGTTRVLIIDDSPIMRHLLTEAIGHSNGFEVVGAAHNATDAWSKIQTEGPDVITLDVEMPGMDGVTFLEYLMRMRPLPVVMVSALTQSGSATTFRALRLGAIDFIGKPSGGAGGVRDAWIAELVGKLRRAAQLGPPASSRPTRQQSDEYEPKPGDRVRSARHCAAEVIAVGCGTGGVEALRRLLSQLPQDCPPVVVMHEFSEIMGNAFLEHVRHDCTIRLKQAVDGDLLVRGQTYLCEARAKSFVERYGRSLRLRSLVEPEGEQSEARIDQLFESCGHCAGNRAAAILLDSASSDGAHGLRQIHKMGGIAISQQSERARQQRSPVEYAAANNSNATAPGTDGISLLLDQIVLTLFE